jgi:hypothetical protein
MDNNRRSFIRQGVCLAASAAMSRGVAGIMADGGGRGGKYIAFALP